MPLLPPGLQVHREANLSTRDEKRRCRPERGRKAAETTQDIAKSLYARKLKKESQDGGQEGGQNRKNLPYRSRLRNKMQAHPAPARAV